MEQPASFDRTIMLTMGTILIVGLLATVALMSSETFMAAQEAMFKAMAVMAEVCRL